MITKENSNIKLNDDLSMTKTEASYVGLNLNSNSRDTKFIHKINSSHLPSNLNLNYKSKNSTNDLCHKKREFEISVLNNPCS